MTRTKRLPDVSQVRYVKLKHPALVVMDRPLWANSSYMLGRGSVVAKALPESRVIIPPSPTGYPNEHYVRWIDNGGTQWMGWLSMKTKFLKTVAKAVSTVSPLGQGGWKSWDAKRSTRLKKRIERRQQAAQQTASSSMAGPRTARFSLPASHSEDTMSTKKKSGKKAATATKSGKKGASKSASAVSAKSKKGAHRESRALDLTAKRYANYVGKRLIRVGDAITTNPRREGSKSWHNWNKITKGMTFEKYIAAGGEFGKLNTYIKSGVLKLK